MKKIYKAFLICVFVALIVACSKDNNDNKQDTPSPKEQWSKTMKGNGEELGAYPDLYSNYWEYTYQIDQHSDKIICLKGEFPHCRYFSLSLYDDETGSAIGGIDDIDILPDKGSENPFTKTVSGKNYFTIYIVPENIDQKVIAKLNTTNIRTVKSGVNRVAMCVRHYLGTTQNGNEADEYGGVELPAISALNINTLKAAEVPEHVVSNITKAVSQVFTQKSDENQTMPFFLAPVSRYYPNNSTAYLYARTHIKEDEVLKFSFIPAPAPTKPEEYATAVTRYWSVCLGSAADTRSYLSLCDNNALYSPNKKSAFIVCLKKNTKLDLIKEKVNQMNSNGELVNLFVWDSEKMNVDNKALGEVVVIMYRNILPNSSWEHSIANMWPTAYKDATGEPIDHVTNPEKQLAHKALKEYGPFGEKISTGEFLALSKIE